MAAEDKTRSEKDDTPPIEIIKEKKTARERRQEHEEAQIKLMNAMAESMQAMKDGNPKEFEQAKALLSEVERVDERLNNTGYVDFEVSRSFPDRSKAVVYDSVPRQNLQDRLIEYLTLLNRIRRVEKKRDAGRDPSLS